MLLTEFIKYASGVLCALYPPQEARSIVSILLEDVLGVDRNTHILNPGYEISPEGQRELESCLRRLADWEPVQYVTGKCCFYGRAFNVSRDVLIPRPETELLVRWALDHIAPGGRVLDLCTGSGCIAWSIALELPGVSVTGIDISDPALQIASRQFSDRQGQKNVPTFIRADVLSEQLPLQEKFDLLISNPPYVMESEKAAMRPNVLEFEPDLALFVPDNDPLIFYEAIARHSLRVLKPSGMGIVEINEMMGESTMEIFKKNGLKKTAIQKDLSGKDRFVTFQKQA